jgi:tetratricopeptide (TPR) repeat protein
MSLYDTSPMAREEESNAIFVNYYEELGLAPDLSYEKLIDAIDGPRLGWLSRSKKPGEAGDEARRMLEVANAALDTFSSEDARERYDVELRRSKNRPTVENQQPVAIDWRSRAWNYYFLGDDGAGRVAARYAREASPKDPLVYVVSAWMHILSANANRYSTRGIDETEIKQAKQDADEAFVLDELGTDTVDVHHVRGFVYYLLDNNEQAISSYERAIHAASDLEKPEVLARKAWAHESLARKHNGGDRTAELTRMLESALSGLGFPFDLSVQVLGWLTEATARAVTYIAQSKSSSQGILDEYRAMLERIRTAKIPDGARAQLVPYIEKHIARVQDLIAVEKRISAAQGRARQLAVVKDAIGARPSIPFISSAIGLVVFFIGIGMGGAALLPVIIGLAILAFAGYRIYRRVSWNSERTAYQAAQAELVQLHNTLPDLEEKKRHLQEPGSFAFRLD